LGRRYYLYDGEELVCELDATGNAVAGVVFGANGLLVYGTTGYQFDPQGNGAHLMDDDGFVLAHLAYDAWGQRMSGNNPTPYGYKGQWGYYTDGETGLLLLIHRYLDPATGRFLTRDPIGFDGGINLYAYVGNSVPNASDPSGEFINPLPPHRRPPIRPWPPGSPRRPCARPYAGGFMPLPGNPRACAPYLHACNMGYVLACNMYYVCMGAGPGGLGLLPPVGGGGANCVRSCLLSVFGSPSLLSCWCAYAQHRECMALCGYSPPWPFDWNTWGLVCHIRLPGSPPPGRAPIPTPPGSGAPS
jgi:RHS repeat-associated protein